MAKGAGQGTKEFISRLRAGSVRPPVTLIGIVKPSEESDHSLMFSSGGCEDWVEIPENAIAEIQTLGLAPCKDHKHPRVRIELAQSDDPMITALSAVLTHVVSSRQSEAVSGQRSHAQPHLVMAGQQPAVSGQRQYFRLTSGGAVCPSAHPNCYGGISNCQYGCACCDGGGECFCSTCCIS